MREQILRMIRLHNGIREVDLALAVMSLVLPQNFDPEEYHRTLFELVDSGEIKKFEYLECIRIHIHIDTAIKSIFFTKETEFLVNMTGEVSGKMVGESKGDT